MTYTNEEMTSNVSDESTYRPEPFPAFSSNAPVPTYRAFNCSAEIVAPPGLLIVES